MDAAAISLARENALPIVVFNIHAPGAFAHVIRGEGRFTRIIEQSHRAYAGYGQHGSRSRQAEAGPDTPHGWRAGTLKREFAGLRTGRAHPGLLEPVKVTPMAGHAAQSGRHCGCPEPRMLTVQVWTAPGRRGGEGDPRCGLGLNPAAGRADGARADPAADHRASQRLAKTAHKYAEGARVAVRAVRRDGMEQIKAHEKKHEIGEDVAKDWHDEVQKLTDQYHQARGRRLVGKEKDIRQV